MAEITDKQLSEITDAVLKAVVPDDWVAELLYGDYMNAVVVYFPYKRSYQCGAEGIEDAVRRFIASRREDIMEALAEELENQGIELEPQVTQ